jgi:hypothetical protein
MRSFLLVALLPAALCAATTLQIVKPIVSQTDGGDADAPGFEHVAGETLYFSCRVEGFAKSEEKVHLTYSVQAFDPKGVALAEIYKNAILEEVLPQDKDWEPKIETEVEVPPLAPPGEYKIVVKAEDFYANTSAELPVTFRVRGLRVDASDKLVVRNFGFYRGEDDAQALARPIFHNGANLWAKWDITGYKYGPSSKVDISWTVSILQGEKVLKAFDSASEQSESIYPKPWVPASFEVPLQKVAVGEYTILVRVKDVTGAQTYETRHNFTVE